MAFGLKFLPDRPCQVSQLTVFTRGVGNLTRWTHSQHWVHERQYIYKAKPNTDLSPRWVDCPPLTDGDNRRFLDLCRAPRPPSPYPGLSIPYPGLPRPPSRPTAPFRSALPDLSSREINWPFYLGECQYWCDYWKCMIMLVVSVVGSDWEWRPDERGEIWLREVWEVSASSTKMPSHSIPH